MVRSFTMAFVALVLLLPAAAGVGAVGGPSGFRTLSGRDAQAFRLPGDVVRVWRAQLPNGLTQTRFQQVVGGATVLGGQLTVLRGRDGTIKAVIGSHYPGLKATNQQRLTARQARGVAAARVGAAGRWITTLRINPVNGRLFYSVENRRFAERWIHWIDAANGAVVNAYNGLAHDGPGTGVKGDTKTVDSSPGATSGFTLTSSDERQKTYDMRNSRYTTANPPPGVLVMDADDSWTTPGVASPGHPAAVDAHYYANVVDDFYMATFGRDSIDDEGMTIVSSVHYARKYNNAFWNGTQMTYGDGDQRDFREFSGSLEVIGHELTHGVTEFTSNLIYEDESGALNESFSDIIGATIERATNEPLSSNCVIVVASTCNDWALAEDLEINADRDTVPGFRNMADPQEDGDPDHYSELVNDPSDNGGVHSNSGISNHAYYLLVTGGTNAGCDTTGSDGHTHTADCSVIVPSIGLSAAAQIFYTGFTSLPENANFCNARNATFAVGGANQAAVGSAWDAVGVHTGCAEAPPPPNCDTLNATIPFETRHPYRSDTNCSWFYTHSSAGFRLVFGRFETEDCGATECDIVEIRDGDGIFIEKLTGVQTGHVTPCIATQTVEVHFQSDQLINKWGWEVVGTQAC